jgi:hypothetical protein
MRLLAIVCALSVLGCTQQTDVPFPVPPLVRATPRQVMSTTAVADPEPVQFEVRDTALGTDHLGDAWTVQSKRELGTDDWCATFTREGEVIATMSIGRLKFGHHPEFRLEVCPERESFIVLKRICCWGTGVWSSCEQWFTLDRLTDVEADVLYVDVSGHQYGWGLAYNRDFVAESELLQDAGIEVHVMGTLEVMWDETPVFACVRKAAYRWHPVYRRFFSTNPREDEALHGMWNDAEDGLVTHSYPELKAWLAGPEGDPVFVQGLLAEAEHESTRTRLRELLAADR